MNSSNFNNIGLLNIQFTPVKVEFFCRKLGSTYEERGFKEEFKQISLCSHAQKQNTSEDFRNGSFRIVSALGRFESLPSTLFATSFRLSFTN